MSLTISRTPLRITLGGGGSDLAPDGLCVTAAISLYNYVVINYNYNDEYILKYSDKVERVKTLEEINHPLIHACMVALNTPPGVEIAWLSDIDGGMGLGGSASFVVGTLMALSNGRLGQEGAAELAIKIDTGWQDQWACAMGGVIKSSRYISRPIGYYPNVFDNMLLVSTSMKHDAKKVLESNARPPQSTLVRQAKDAINALLQENAEHYLAECFNEQWNDKRMFAKTTEHRDIHELMQNVIKADGMKLVGAGNGGYVLAINCTEDLGDLETLPVRIDSMGSVIL